MHSHKYLFSVPIVTTDFPHWLLIALITWGCHISNWPLCYIGHESHDGEDDEACKHAGEGVDAADNDRISAGERQSTRQPLSRLYPFLINPSHIVEMHGWGGWGRRRDILPRAVAQRLSAFILNCSSKMAVSSSCFNIAGTTDVLIGECERGGDKPHVPVYDVTLRHRLKSKVEHTRCQ